MVGFIILEFLLPSKMDVERSDSTVVCSDDDGINGVLVFCLT